MIKKHLFLLLFVPFFSFGQVFEYTEKPKQETHRIMMDDEYLVETIFASNDGAFINARGGYYTKKGDRLQVTFEFNANYTADRLTTISLDPSNWKKVSLEKTAFEGNFLMAGRVNPEGEQRRDLNRSRKTMKFLYDGFFQWIAFDTNDLRFIATGGGKYTAKNGKYIETIEFFSRDKSRVGKVLPFTYVLKGNDWYHQGKSSKGKPMHEIWQQRNQ